jgi:hypothetical protein
LAASSLLVCEKKKVTGTSELMQEVQRQSGFEQGESSEGVSAGVSSGQQGEEVAVPAMTVAAWLTPVNITSAIRSRQQVAMWRMVCT